jgi:sarcosine oxidase subunit beta
MKSSAEVVIIGGGVIGMSVARHLALAGCADVVVLERAHIAAGSSSKGVGGFRQQFDTEINARLSQLSLPTLLELGEQIELRQRGYMYLALSEESLARIRAKAERQRAWGVPVELLSADEVRARCPYLHTADVLGAAFCTLDGYARPPLAVAAYAREAAARGVEVVEGAAVTAFELAPGGDGQRVEALVTTRGRIAARHVVLAAGPWAAQVAALAGQKLPVTPLKRQTFATPPWGGAPDAPLTIDEDTGWHFRPEGDALRVALSGGETPGVEDFTIDPELGRRAMAGAIHRLPGLRAAFGDGAPEPASGKAGLYEMTPDAHPILGPAPGVAGLIYACGFSGHGFMHSAAAGQLIAELITQGHTTSLDIAPLSVTRFAEGRLLGEGNTL